MKPLKIVAGLEPENTNVLLLGLAKAASGLPSLPVRPALARALSGTHTPQRAAHPMACNHRRRRDGSSTAPEEGAPRRSTPQKGTPTARGSAEERAAKTC